MNALIIFPLIYTCAALPFWGSEKFHKKRTVPVALKPRFNQDQCYVLLKVMHSKLPISIRKNALQSIGENCAGKNNPPASRKNKSIRHRLFESYHGFWCFYATAPNSNIRHLNSICKPIISAFYSIRKIVSIHIKRKKSNIWY